MEFFVYSCGTDAREVVTVTPLGEETVWWLGWLVSLVFLAVVAVVVVLKQRTNNAYVGGKMYHL